MKVETLHPTSQALNVERIGQDSYRSTFLAPYERAMDGGQLASQALNAAFDTVPGQFHPNSIHASFIAAGDSMLPVNFSVSRDRDGRSFATRHVAAHQGDRLILRVTASFQIPTPGLDVQLAAMPAVSDPMECAPQDTYLYGLEARNPDTQLRIPPASAWVRPEVPLGADARENYCALLYISDMGNGLSDVTEMVEGSFLTSLDHTLWFHRPVVLDDWLLVDLHGASLASERLWFSGHYFSGDGVHVATASQELLYRPPRA